LTARRRLFSVCSTHGSGPVDDAIEAAPRRQRAIEDKESLVAERVHQAGLRDVQDTLRILGDPRETVQITVLSELQLVSKAIFS
jgi:hypothetical protein